ncbi:MAG: N-acetylmuramoyl-L-alanine amidase [Chloroflexota bacterium]|nr:N-acetylmuramoyl-L-alanine amidase [Chloroflexota bacterium]
MVRRSGRIFLLLAVALAVAPSPWPVLGTSALIEGFAVQGSPFQPDGDGIRDTVAVSFSLTRPAISAVDVIDHDGGIVRRLRKERLRQARQFHIAWDGRRDDGLMAAHGAYRLRVSARDGTDQQAMDGLVTKAKFMIYPPRPQAVLIAIDPGHGLTWSGAVAPDGSREADFNLDIGLRLRAMLEGAGARVAMTRSSNTDANDPPLDRNGDGLVEYVDDLAARPDIANPAGADVFLSLHNNIANETYVGGPSTFYNPDRTFSAESARLAQLVQRQMVARLRAYRTDAWRPYDHGVLTYDYYVLKPYSLPRLPRPSLMPGILGESLFLSHPFELSLLKKPEVRQSIAVAYYNAIAKYFAGRPEAAGYEGSLSVDRVVAGEALIATVEITSRGMSPARGWSLDLHAAPGVGFYDGSGRRDERLGSMVLPDLHPGESVQVEVALVAPAQAGAWIIKADVRLPDGAYLSDRGSPALQLRLDTDPEVGPPTPTADATGEPTPSP